MHRERECAHTGASPLTCRSDFEIVLVFRADDLSALMLTLGTADFSPSHQSSAVSAPSLPPQNAINYIITCQRMEVSWRLEFTHFLRAALMEARDGGKKSGNRARHWRRHKADLHGEATEPRSGRKRPSYHGCMVAACHIGCRKRCLRLTLSESLFSLGEERRFDLK